MQMQLYVYAYVDAEDGFMKAKSLPCVIEYSAREDGKCSYINAASRSLNQSTLVLPQYVVLALCSYRCFGSFGCLPA
jgi:hypothetical protein